MNAMASGPNVLSANAYDRCMSEAASHTAEHIFAGALNRMIPGLKVHKVELGAVNSVYLDLESLNWDAILEAERIVNKIIGEARPVKAHEFGSLEEAVKSFPGLRSRDERISGEVRVIEIEGHDYAACAGHHVHNTAECTYFLVSGFSRSGGLAKVEFLVGEEAIGRSLGLCKSCFRAAEILGMSVDKLEDGVEGLKLECQSLRGRLRDTTGEALNRIVPSERSGFAIYSACLKGADERATMEKAGELIEGDAKAVAIFGVEGKSTLYILARGAGASFDCRTVLNEALGSRGFKGGGKPGFANGTVTEGICSENIGLIIEKVQAHSDPI